MTNLIYNKQFNALRQSFAKVGYTQQLNDENQELKIGPLALALSTNFAFCTNQPNSHI